MIRFCRYPFVGYFGLFLLGTSSVIAQTFSADSLRLAQITDDSVRLRQLADLAVNAPYDHGQKPQQALLTLHALRAWQQKYRPQSLFLTAYLIDREGRLRQFAGQQAQALAAFQGALDLFKSAANHGYVVRTIQRIAALYTELEQPKESERYMRQSLTYLDQHPLPPGEQRRLRALAYEHLSTAAARQGREFESLRLLKQAQSLYAANGDSLEYRTTLVNEAVKYRKLGRYREAVAANFRAEAAFLRAHDPVGLPYIYSNLPSALMGLGRYDEAERYARRALALSDSTPQRWIFREDIFKTLAQIYEKQARWQEALGAYRAHQAAHDTLFNQRQREQLQTLEVTYQTRQQEEKIAALGAQNTARQRQILALATGATLLLLLAGGLYVLTVRLRRSRYRIQQQSDQMQLLLRELHHRVKNNLAMVSGLLELQGNRLGDETARQAFAEGRQRVQAMALLHQRLYQAEAPTSIEPAEYVSDLVRTLSEAYGYHPDNLALDIRVEVPALDVDTAIPLGLILNELLTNAFKHALPLAAQPRLSVWLLGLGSFVELTVADSGPGLDRARWEQPGGSFGKRLVAALTEQLRGTLTLDTRAGTRFLLRLPLPNTTPLPVGNRPSEAA
jgi:two-component sensor histidine kinase